MNTAVEVGARSTRKHARLHISGGCGWATCTPLIGKLETLTAKNAHRCCRNCRKAIRVAIDAVRDLASRAQGYGRAISLAVREGLDRLADLFAAPSTLSTAGYNPEYDAERAAIAADWAAQAAPVSPRTLAEMRAHNLRTHKQPVGHVATVKLAA